MTPQYTLVVSPQCAPEVPVPDLPDRPAPQRKALARLFGCVRVVYNDAVAARKHAYREGLPYPTRAVTKNAGFKVLAGGRLRLPKVGDLHVPWSRELPSDPSSVTVIKTPTGKYYASFVVQVDDGSEVLEPPPDPEAETGIDLGLKDFAVLRGGKVIESPKFFRRLERKLKKTQRALSRKKQHSNNYKKARVKVAAVHERIRAQRLEELGVRRWACGCGAVHDRDANAEMNIRREGRRLAAAAAEGLPDA